MLTLALVLSSAMMHPAWSCMQRNSPALVCVPNLFVDQICRPACTVKPVPVRKACTGHYNVRPPSQQRSSPPPYPPCSSCSLPRAAWLWPGPGAPSGGCCQRGGPCGPQPSSPRSLPPPPGRGLRRHATPAAVGGRRSARPRACTRGGAPWRAWQLLLGAAAAGCTGRAAGAAAGAGPAVAGRPCWLFCRARPAGPGWRRPGGRGGPSTAPACIACQAAAQALAGAVLGRQR